MFKQKLFCANLEKAAQRFEEWPGSVGAMGQFTKQMRAEKAKKATA